MTIFWKKKLRLREIEHLPKAIHPVNRNITYSVNKGSDVGTSFKDHVLSIRQTARFGRQNSNMAPGATPFPRCSNTNLGTPVKGFCRYD